ncbi:MAG: N-acetyltransferase family protein [Chloroflexota bacterium]
MQSQFIGQESRERHIVARLWRRIARRPLAAYCYVYFIDLTKAPDRSADTRVSVTWEIGDNQDAVESRVCVLPAENWSDVGDRLALNHWCLVGLCDGAVAHVAWAGVGRFKAYWSDRWFRLQPDDAYLYGAYTMPRFRGLRIHPASALSRLQEMRKRGVRRVYWFVDPSNHAARQLPAKVGAVRVGIAGFLEVAGIRLHFLTDVGHLTWSNPPLLIEKR